MHLSNQQIGINGRMMSNLSTKYQLVTGLEIHAELKTKSGMFCGCKNEPSPTEPPNSHTCPVCLGMPGALPVANKKAIEWTIMVGLALNCKINMFSKFDRKHYFYPDLPKGYQISQYDIPFCYDGFIESNEGKIRIRRIHLEEDTARLSHSIVNGKKVSLIDFNRSGTPLLEIVTEPDIKSAKQAAEVSKKIRQILRYLDVSDCNMQEGGMRLEANVSVKKASDKKLPKYKVELKNINSFKFMESAIDFEIERQSQLLEKGETPNQETRGWNANQNKTFAQRSKEEAEDYRYFPDPDLPPIRITEEHLKEIKSQVPELPSQKAARLTKEYSLDEALLQPVLKTRKSAEWYEELFKEGKTSNLHADQIVKAIDNKKVKAAPGDDLKKTILQISQLFQTDDVDENELDAAIESVKKANPDAVEKFQNGDQKVFGFFMGQVMRELKVKADPKAVSSRIRQKLSE